MNMTAKQLLRIAHAVRGQLLALRMSRQHQVGQKLAMLAGEIERLQKIRRQLCICESRSWNAASAKLSDNIHTELAQMRYVMPDITRTLETQNDEVPVVSEIYWELVQTGEEFHGLNYDKTAAVLSVTTEPIELEEVYLGKFEIQLYISNLSDTAHRNPYQVEALDPHPATGNESVTHPHVSDKHLCAGDGSTALHTALTSGRICDFFVLARSVLTNYNSSSPYVKIEEWDGAPCYDCGYVTSEDDRFWCASCENDFCEECISSCRVCEESHCRNCLEECEACGDLVCSSCTRHCSNCNKSICKFCFEEAQCPCLEEIEDEEAVDIDSSTEAA